MIRQNIFAKPFVVTVRMNGVTLDRVFWDSSEENLRERLRYELSEKIELVRIKERE